MKNQKRPMVGPTVACAVALLFANAVASAGVGSATSPSGGSARGSAKDAVPVPVKTSRLPDVLVHKSPGCSCCELWVKHLQASGFKVRVNETTDLNTIRQKVGVPTGKGSCHTAQAGKLFVEGHVPADAIKAALSKPSGLRGLVLPGMPGGAPGMAAPPGGAPLHR